MYIIIPITLLIIFHFSSHSLEFVSENIISVLSGILAYIGTTVLGIVSVWQNQKAFFVNNNLMNLQRSEFEKNKSSIIRFKDNIDFSLYEFNQEFFTQSQKLPQNFYILADENYKNDTNKVECIDLFFENIGYEISKIKIESVSIKAKSVNKKYSPLYDKTKTGFCYDFEKQAYKLSLLLFSDKIFVEDCVKENETNLDIVLNLYSKADVQSHMHITVVLEDYSKTKHITSVMYYYYKDEIL